MATVIPSLIAIFELVPITIEKSVLASASALSAAAIVVGEGVEWLAISPQIITISASAYAVTKLLAH